MGLSDRANALFDRLSQGEDVRAVMQAAKFPRAISREFGELSTFRYSDLIGVAGAPQDEIKVLVDMNVGFEHAVELYQHFGNVHYAQLLMKGNTPDPQLYDYARENGFDLIITKDGKNSNPDDLCYVAHKHFSGQAAGVPVLVVPNTKDLPELLEHNHGSIVETARSKASAVLDLRENHPAEQGGLREGSWLYNYLKDKGYDV